MALADASDVLVWRDGFLGWKPAKDVVELKEKTPLPIREARNEDKEGPAKSKWGRLTPEAHNVEKLLRSGKKGGSVIGIIVVFVLVLSWLGHSDDRSTTQSTFATPTSGEKRTL